MTHLQAKKNGLLKISQNINNNVKKSLILKYIKLYIGGINFKNKVINDKNNRKLLSKLKDVIRIKD